MKAAVMQNSVPQPRGFLRTEDSYHAAGAMLMERILVVEDDRAVQKVAANTKPFLLQTYRRDMGAGKFVLMKDLSAPIFVNGRHWGAFRVGFRHKNP